MNHLKASVVLDTFPKVMRAAFPGVKSKLHAQDMYAEIGDGSQIWFAGLDDKDRTEKILGMEFATLYFNECSQIPLGSIDTAMTRLAQLCHTSIEGAKVEPLKLRAYYDCNPPAKTHWTYRRFVEKRDPVTRVPLTYPLDYDCFQINPRDNVANLSPEYIKTLESLPERMRKRFLDGSFADANPNALFPSEEIDKWRVIDGKLPPLVRIVVAVDPSGADESGNSDNDAIGIIVVGVGQDGNAYVLEDCTVKAGPATWGRVATSAFDRHKADLIVGETNYGGAMVRHTVQVSRPQTPFLAVTASRGKVQRAEPFSALYEAGKVRHAGSFPELEDELSGFSTSGYTGTGSPNRADALIWALAALFPGVTRAQEQPQLIIEPPKHYW
jgi:predicted phage terminase large subunit-like protein